MSTDIEQELRGAMERFTGGVRVPPGLAVKAYRHQQKRRVTTRAMVAAGTAAVLAAGGVAAAGAAGAFGSASPSPAPATYTAFVVNHVEHALSAPATDNLIGYARTSFPPGTQLTPVTPFELRISERPGVSSPWSVGQTVRWSYRAAMRMTAFSPAGQPVLAMKFTHVLGQHPASQAVIYGSRTWWQATMNRPGGGSGPVSCGPGVRLSGGAGEGWPAFVRAQLACGEFTVAGHQQVDGVDTIKIVAKQGNETLWVSPSTYLPVRLIMGLSQNEMQTDFGWLAPTPANLAQLTLTVPAGFTQVSPPPEQSAR